MPSERLDVPAGNCAAAIAEGQRLARSLVAENNLPGLSVAVAVDGTLVWAEGLGWADHERQLPVTPRTRFRIGGVTKTITATAAALLVARGQLDLDAPVQRLVPEFPPKRWPVTTRHLLGHTAGIGPGWHGRATPCTDDRERLASFAADTLRFEPGTRHQYATRGYVLVGAVVGAAAGESYLRFVRREVLAPLGMADTVADRPDGAPPRTARFYFPRLATDPRWGLQDAPAGDLTCVLPAIGLLSTPADLVRLGAAMLQGDLVPREVVVRFQTPQRLASGEPIDAGLGWFIRRLPLGPERVATRVVGHRGNVAGGTTSLQTVPDHGLVIAVTSNVTFARAVSTLADALADIFVRMRAGGPGDL
jgi:CubicO group peptidase (beta-lactamase class C family)